MDVTKSAVLVIGFNRPDLLTRTLAAVAQYGPKKLYFACDGPRDGVLSDAELVSESRGAVHRFSWSCEVKHMLQEQNLGLRASMVAAIDWFFANESEGIVLEDDCLAGADFFSFMEHALVEYRDQRHVWGATGSNPSGAPVADSSSYGFVRTALVWGWASWADRWALYDRGLEAYQKSGWAGKKKFWKDPFEYHALDWHLDRIAKGSLHSSWAYPWAWTVTHNEGLWVVPAQNLVANIGFRSDATHTRSAGNLNQRLENIGKLHIPTKIERDAKLQHHIHSRQHRVLRPLWLNYFRNVYRVSPIKRLLGALSFDRRRH